MANFYQVDKEFDGVKYTAQFNGLREAVRAIDNAKDKDTNNISVEKLTRYLLNNVIVSPRLKIEEFAAEKIGEEYTREIGGIKYTAKFNGVLPAIRAIDNGYVNGASGISLEKFSDYALKEIITEPANLTIDDFDSLEDLNEVVAFAGEAMNGGDTMEKFNAITSFATDVMNGRFRDTVKQPSTKKKGS